MIQIRNRRHLIIIAIESIQIIHPRCAVWLRWCRCARQGALELPAGKLEGYDMARGCGHLLTQYLKNRGSLFPPRLDGDRPLLPSGIRDRQADTTLTSAACQKRAGDAADAQSAVSRREGEDHLSRSITSPLCR